MIKSVLSINVRYKQLASNTQTVNVQSRASRRMSTQIWKMQSYIPASQFPVTAGSKCIKVSVRHCPGTVSVPIILCKISTSSWLIILRTIVPCFLLSRDLLASS